MQTDAERWDQRWVDKQAAVPSEPDALALAGVALPTAGRALDLACGLGANAVWLALRGLDVDAVDVSPVAIQATQLLATAHRVECNAELADFDNGLPATVTGPYDVVVCQRFRDPALYDDLKALLSPTGVLAITVLSVVGREDQSSPFLAAAGELATAFGDLDVLFAHEADGQAHLVARPHQSA